MAGRLPRKAREAMPDTSIFSASAAMIRYADKATYAQNQTIFNITALEYQPHRGYNGVDRWAVTVTHADGKTVEIITLPANDKRNAQLLLAKAQIKERGPLANLLLVRSGSAYYFRPAAAQVP